MMLTDQQVEAFGRDGYLSLDAITTPDEVAVIRDIYDRLFAERAGWRDGNLFDFAGTEDDGEVKLPQMLNLSKYAPELARTRFRANAEAVAKRLLGPEAELVFEHAIRKPPRVGPPTPWHQDEAFFNGQTDYESLTIWVPLQAATVENGCMRYVPGSHVGPLVPHRSIGDDPRVHGLEAVGVDEAAAVHAPIPAGGAAIHYYRTLHAAGPNTSEQPRRAYALGFGVRGRRAPQAEFPWNAQKCTARQGREAEAKRRLGRRVKKLVGSFAGHAKRVVGWQGPAWTPRPGPAERPGERVGPDGRAAP